VCVVRPRDQEHEGRPRSYSARQNNMRVPPRLEITLLITAYIAGIVGVGLGTRLIVEAVGPHPAVAQAVYWTIVPATGLGGLIAFSFLCSRVEFLWRGYQVRFRQGRAYYEEPDASGERRGLAFDWCPLTEGYRPRGLVGLSPLGTWELDAQVWARGRRDDIAGRITKDLSSYEGWPALLMPDAPTVDSPADTNPTSTLIRAIVDRWPEWAPYVVSGAEGRRADGVLLSVPPPDKAKGRRKPTTSRCKYLCGGPQPAEFGVRVGGCIVSGSQGSPPYRTVQVHIAKAVPAIAHPADLLAPGTNGR